jgi:hypothetical protein
MSVRCRSSFFEAFLLSSFLFSLACGADAARPPDPIPGPAPTGYTIFDAAYYVMPQHLGEAVLGAMGNVNGDTRGRAPEGRYVQVRIAEVDPESGRPAIRVVWDFTKAPPEAFTGVYFSLNAQVDVLDSLDGKTTALRSLPDHVLDLDDLDAPLARPGRPKEAADKLCLRLRTASRVLLRLEIQSSHAAGTTRDLRRAFVLFDPASLGAEAKGGWRSGCFPLADFRQADPGRPFDRTRAKVVALVVVHDSLFPRIANPATGSLDLDEVWFDGPHRVTREVLLAKSDADFVEFLAFKAGVRLARLASPVPEIRGLAQDRDSFGNLVSVAAQGFLLASLPEFVRRGWMSRADAARMAFDGLDRLAKCPDSGGVPGPIATGYCKHHGIFYHFLGMDGKRKRNFDYPDSPDLDESRNGVERSVIDTGLLLAGAAVAQRFFDGAADPEPGIRAAAERLLAEADWRSVYSPVAGRMHMSWMPTETGIAPTPVTGWGFAWPDACAAADLAGYFASRPDGFPLELDYYTVEAVLADLLAAAAPLDHRPPNREWLHFVSCPSPCPGASCAPRCLGSSGAAFVYQFDRLLGLDTSRLVTNSGVNLGESQCAVLADAVKASAADLDLPGAHETPYQTYTANARNETLHPDFQPSRSDGGLAPYAWAGTLACDDPDSQATVLAALRRMIRDTPVFHSLIGLADVYYPRLLEPPSGARKNGAWVNHSSFGIDQGPVFLGLHRALCRLRNESCPLRLSGHPLFATALANAAGASTGWIEGEWTTIRPPAGGPSCALKAAPQEERCGPRFCEGPGKDAFPFRARLSGGRAAMLFGPGAEAVVDEVRISGAAVRGTLDYSLGWDTLYDQIRVEVFLDAETAPRTVLAALPSTHAALAPDCAPDGWNCTRTIAFDLGPVQPGSHQVRIRLAASPASWGFQIDRVRFEASNDRNHD